MRRLARLLAFVAALHGCASATSTTAPTSNVVTAPPAPPRMALSAPDDGMLSGTEAATVLRHAALLRAFTASDVYLATLHLRAIWEDSWSWADQGALLEMLDRFVREPISKEVRMQTGELRLDLARAWLDRGNRERARALAAMFDDEASSSRVELAAALDGIDEAKRVAATAEYPVEPPELDWILADATARWGDVAVAERLIQALPADRRCSPAVGLAERRYREHAADAAKWLDVAEASLAAREDDDVRDCALGAIRAATRIGPSARVSRILSGAKSWSAYQLCVVTYETFDAVEPTLLDEPLLESARREAASGAEPWDSCPTVMAELAARRGDGRLAHTFLRRDVADTGITDDDDVEGPDYAWSARVRLGRADPFERGRLGKRVFDILLLARILENRPELRVDRARLQGALETDGEAGAPVDGDDDEDAGADAPAH